LDWKYKIRLNDLNLYNHLRLLSIETQGHSKHNEHLGEQSNSAHGN